MDSVPAVFMFFLYYWTKPAGETELNAKGKG